MPASAGASPTAWTSPSRAPSSEAAACRACTSLRSTWPERITEWRSGLDGEHFEQFYSHLSFKNLTFTGAYGSRQKTVPTASFGTLFNEQAFPEETTDRHMLLDGEYAHSIGATHLVARATYDRFSAGGVFPFAGDTSDALPLIGDQTVLGSRWSAELRLTRALPGRQVLTAGAEFIDNLHQDQHVVYNVPGMDILDDGSSTQHALYARMSGRRPAG